MIFRRGREKRIVEKMKQAPKPRTRLSPEARKNQLLDVSKEMILAEGLHGFSIEALARTAGVSSPLVYNYFKSRLDTLQTLLHREYTQYSARLREAMRSAASFEEVVRINIESNFDHYSPGNIIPILQSQPEIVSAITKELDRNNKNLAKYLVQTTAETYNLQPRQAELVVSMSSGASVAAAGYASNGRVNRDKAIDAALRYILAGLEQAGRDEA